MADDAIEGSPSLDVTVVVVVNGTADNAIEGSPSLDESEEIQPLSFRRRTARILALLAVLLIVGLWGWALFFPPSTTAPGTLKDQTFPTAANPICTDAAAAMATLPPAFETTDPIERANVVAQSDVILTTMLNRLDAIAPPPGQDKDALNISEWLSDWRTFVGDRETYAAALRNNPTARFYVTEKARRQISAPIDFFATFNNMQNCVTPDDIE